MPPRTAPPATTLLNKFLRDGETEAASAAGIKGLLKAPAALTTRAACNFSIWFILEAITVDFLVARTATLRTPAHERRGWGDGTRERREKHREESEDLRQRFRPRCREHRAGRRASPGVPGGFGRTRLARQQSRDLRDSPGSDAKMPTGGAARPVEAESSHDPLRLPLTCLGAILAVRLFITVAFIFFAWFACGWCFGRSSDCALLGSFSCSSPPGRRSPPRSPMKMREESRKDFPVEMAHCGRHFRSR